MHDDDDSATDDSDRDIIVPNWVGFAVLGTVLLVLFVLVRFL